MDESSRRTRKRFPFSEECRCSIFAGMTSVLDLISSPLFPSPLVFCFCQNLYSYLQTVGNDCSYKGIPCEKISHFPSTLSSY